MHRNQSITGEGQLKQRKQSKAEKEKHNNNNNNMRLLMRKPAINLAMDFMQTPSKFKYQSAAALPIIQHNNVQFQRSYAQKQNLLCFPAMPLKNTLELFVKTTEPLLTPEELKKTKEAVCDFAQGDGKELQKLLENAAKCEDNWLAPRWLKVAYMQFRSPVTAYSSPGMTFPWQYFKSEDDFLLYAGKCVYGMAKFKLDIDAGKIPVVKMGKFELDNSQFGVVYGTCRIPRLEEDKMDYNPKSNYVVVIYKNHFYKMAVYNKKGVPLHPGTLAAEFKKIMSLEKKKGPAFGSLTADHRDNWAKAYDILMGMSENRKAIRIIQKCMFTVSLDDCVEINQERKWELLGEQLIHGGGVKQNIGNRWMDKTIQLIVNPNGMSGFCYEHSPAEGQPVALVSDFITANLNNDKHYEGAACSDYDCPQKIKLTTNECINSYLDKANRTIEKIVTDLDMKILRFKDYGKEFLKQQKLSPDSYIQIALQYAFIILHKKPTPQYESAHLRIYYGGRTETIRSCSNESFAFAKAMLCGTSCDEEKVKLLRAAVDGHRKYTTLALQGKGVDRHLLGLKLMAIENCMPVPDFYKCPGFVKSSYWQVSTSQVASNYEAFMCYGPGVDDGYGCCYNPRKNDIILAVSSWRSNKTSDSIKYAEAITRALCEMQSLLCKAGEKPKAKL